MTNPKSAKLSRNTEALMFDGKMQLEIEKMDLSKREQLKLMSSVLLSALSQEEGAIAYTLIPFITRHLSTYSLNSYYDPSEIALEAYWRTIKRINSGEVIEKPVIWLQRVSLKIIMELKKSHRNQEKLHNRVARGGSTVSEDCFLPDYTTDDNARLLVQSFSKLKDDDRQILILREVKSLQWVEIGEFLVKTGKEKVNDRKLQNRLRQKGKRALDLLRKNYTISQSFCSATQSR